MSKGILGRKIGMTQIFNENGQLIPVTVVDVADNVVLQQKTIEKTDMLQLKLDMTLNETLANKPEMGHVAKANSAPKRFVREIRFKENELAELEVEL